MGGLCLWDTIDTKSPQLDNAPLVYFTDTEIASRRHATKVEKIFSDVMNKSVPKYKGIFSADVIQKWAVWKECKLQRWNTISESARSERMVLPQPCALRQPHFNHILNHHNLEDSVPADMGDEIELVCFNSGVMAVFQRPPKRDVLHHIIADEEELFASTKPVFLNQVCIFKYVYPNKLSGEEITQISVGQIVKCMKMILLLLLRHLIFAFSLPNVQNLRHQSVLTLCIKT